MAPTEYRVIAKRATLRPIASLRGLVAAGEALNPEVLRAWQEATGLQIRDGYGQTETGQLTGMRAGRGGPAGVDGAARCRASGLTVDDGELVVDPATVPTFFLRYLGDAARGDRSGRGAPWRTGDRVTRDEDGFLFFEGRTDDVIISAGYRIGPFEVESALVAHEAVAEAAVVAAPDDERGSIVRAVVVLRDGFVASGRARAARCRTTSRSRPRPTSTRAASTSPTSCPRRPAARSGARCCARRADGASASGCRAARRSRRSRPARPSAAPHADRDARRRVGRKNAP